MILTAAHCVIGWPKRKMESSGSLDVLTNSMESKWDSLYVHIKAVYVHPSWPADFDVTDQNSRRKYNMSVKDMPKLFDLAIIELERDLNLPVATIDPNPLQIGESATFGGFGCRNYDQQGAGTLTVALKKIDKFVQNNFVSGSKNLHDGQSSALCDGDSGGPVYRGTSQNRVIGINSGTSTFWRFNFGNYAVRLDAPAAQSWIQSITTLK